LANIAAQNAGKPEFKDLMDGPTGLVIGSGDPIESLKLLVSFAKSNDMDVSIFAIAMEGQTYDSSQVIELAKLLAIELTDLSK
jgi:ribosomal protein L10